MSLEMQCLLMCSCLSHTPSLCIDAGGDLADFYMVQLQLMQIPIQEPTGEAAAALGCGNHPIFTQVPWWVWQPALNWELLH